MKKGLIKSGFATLFVVFFGCSSSTDANSNLDDVTDIDGNIYQTVISCSQTWTKSNLNVSKYSDGTLIPQVNDPAQWANLTTGAWCYYENSTENGFTYGKLYNWYAVAGIYDAASLSNTALRKKLAPTGWHIPTDTEWTALIDCLGGETVAGGKMKETNTGFWQSPNIGATNESNFTAFPGGYRDYNGTFNDLGNIGYWWSSTEDGIANAWSRYLLYDTAEAGKDGNDETSGFSVRCVKD